MIADGAAPGRGARDDPGAARSPARRPARGGAGDPRACFGHRARLRVGRARRARSGSAASAGTRSLAALVRKELIRPHEAIDDTFRFRHILIRDAAYDRIPKAQARRLHERFAGWLDGRGEEFEEIIGYHLEQAHACLVELGPGDRPQPRARRASGPPSRCVRQARLRSRRSVRRCRPPRPRRERSFPASDPDRLTLLPMLGRALTDQGEWERAKVLLVEAIEQGKASGELAIAADASVAHLYLWLHMDPQASHAAMRPPLEEAIRVFEGTGDLAGLANALLLAGQMRFWRGDAQGAMADLERAADHAREAGDRTLEAEDSPKRLDRGASRPDACRGDGRISSAIFRRRAPGSRRLEMSACSSTPSSPPCATTTTRRVACIAEAEVCLRESSACPLDEHLAAEVELLAGDGARGGAPAPRRARGAGANRRLGSLRELGGAVRGRTRSTGPRRGGAGGSRSRCRYTIEDDIDARSAFAAARLCFWLLDGDLVAAEERARKA